MKKQSTKKKKRCTMYDVRSTKGRLPRFKYDRNGLIPAIIQDKKSGDVLMVAYMNKESLKITLKEKRTCFYSRSRKTLWRKGETSGSVQKVKSIHYDCDQDALLIKVEQRGVACHTGSWSCFYRKIFTPLDL